MEIITVTVLFIALVVWLAPRHSRTSHLPRAPLGADSRNDRDLARMTKELQVLRDLRDLRNSHDRP